MAKECRATRLVAMQLRASTRRARRKLVGPIFAMDDPTGTTEDVGHVLVVDDNEAVRQSLADILRLGGYTVSEAAGESEAANVLAGGGVSLLLLDAGLGRSWLAILDQIDNPPPVILMSGTGEAPTTDPRVSLFLPKPIPPARLLEVVAFHMSK